MSDSPITPEMTEVFGVLCQKPGNDQLLEQKVFRVYKGSRICVPGGRTRDQTCLSYYITTSQLAFPCLYILKSVWAAMTKHHQLGVA